MRPHWLPVLFVVVVSAWTASAASMAVTSVTTSDVDLADQTRTNISGTGGPFSVTYDGIERQVTSLTAGGNVYNPTLFGTVAVRRNSASETFPTSNANQTVAFNAVSSIVGSSRTVHGRYFNTMDALLASRNLFTGTENLFVNTDPGSNPSTNVERVDFQFAGGLQAGPGKGFVVFERGGGGGGTNGGFKIAAITAVNGSGVPTNFGTVVTIADDSYTNGGNGIGTAAGNYDVLRFNSAGGPELDFISNPNLGPQHIAGVFIPTTDLAASGVTIFGYALFGLDVTATGANLADTTNPAFFPIDTDFSNDVDLVSMGATLYVVPVPEPARLLPIAAAAAAAAAVLRRARRAVRAD